MVLQGHHGSVNAVALTAEGRKAVSGSWDDTLRVWDLATGEELARLYWAGNVEACACAGGAARIVAGDSSGLVYVLALENVALGPPVETAWSPPDGSLAVRCPFCEGHPFRQIREAEQALGHDWPCPVCTNVLHLNPFTIAADWHTIACEEE